MATSLLCLGVSLVESLILEASRPRRTAPAVCVARLLIGKGDPECKGAPRSSSSSSPPKFPKPMRKPTSQPSSSTSYRGGGQQAHVTEASVVDLMPVGSATTFNVEFNENPEIYEINVTEETYGQEPAEIFVVGGLAEALSTSTRSPGILEGDKEYVAAVDTACNKTCAGEQWIRLMRDCLKGAPHYIQALVDEQPTTDFFKFGNGGVLTSQLRVRLPVCLMGQVVLVWISSVPCGSLGCLIGKDLLESLGAVLDILGRKMMLKFLGPEWINLSKMRDIFH